MPTIHGHSDKFRTNTTNVYTTINPGDGNRLLLDVSQNTYSLRGTDAAEASSTSSVINATAHAAKIGDIIEFTAGALSGERRIVISTTTNTITVNSPFSAAPSTDAFSIFKPDIIKLTSAGTIPVSMVTADDVVDFFDTPLLVASSTNIPASASAPLTVVASLAADVGSIEISDTTGEYIGVYSDPAGTPVLECIIGPGHNGPIPVQLAAGTVIGVRNMQNATISTGFLAINFIG